jgi:hypothetical protein
MDPGLHAGRVHTELAVLGHVRLSGQLGGALHQSMQGLGLQSVRPADQRGVVRVLLPGQTAEPAQDPVLVDLILGLLNAPVL